MPSVRFVQSSKHGVSLRWSGNQTARALSGTGFWEDSLGWACACSLSASGCARSPFLVGVLSPVCARFPCGATFSSHCENALMRVRAQRERGHSLRGVLRSARPRSGNGECVLCEAARRRYVKFALRGRAPVRHGTCAPTARCLTAAVRGVASAGGRARSARGRRWEQKSKGCSGGIRTRVPPTPLLKSAPPTTAPTMLLGHCKSLFSSRSPSVRGLSPGVRRLPARRDFERRGLVDLRPSIVCGAMIPSCEEALLGRSARVPSSTSSHYEGAHSWLRGLARRSRGAPRPTVCARFLTARCEGSQNVTT